MFKASDHALLVPLHQNDMNLPKFFGNIIFANATQVLILFQPDFGQGGWGGGMVAILGRCAFNYTIHSVYHRVVEYATVILE